jgi:hypothetical protein
VARQATMARRDESATSDRPLGWASVLSLEQLLEQDLGGGHGIATAGEQLDGVMEIDLARGDAFREVHRVSGFEKDVQPPALDLRGLVLVPERRLGRLGHARVIRRSAGHPFRPESAGSLRLVLPGKLDEPVVDSL